MHIGLKLWSTNTDFYLNEAERLADERLIDYVELYVVPGSDDKLTAWKRLNLRIELHAPHYDSGVNLADPQNRLANVRAYDLVKKYQEELRADYVVIHSGIEGSVDEVIRQLTDLRLNRYLIENKPYLGPTDPTLHCRGAVLEECMYLRDCLGCGFCLDFGHAICTANYLGVDPYRYVDQFSKLQPRAFHLSDNQIDSAIDAHLHYGNGNYDFCRLLSYVSDDADLAIETRKDSPTSLDDFRRDVECLISYVRHL